MATMDADNFHIFFPLSVAVAAQVHFVVSVYQAHVKVLTGYDIELFTGGVFLVFFL